VSTTGDRLDVLYLTHNYPRHPTDFAGRFIAHLAALIQTEGRFGRIGILAPHYPGAATEETLDGIAVRRFRYGADADEQIAYQGDWRGVSLTGPRGLWAHRRFFRSFSRAAHAFVAQSQPRLIHAHWWVPAGWVARSFGRRLPLVVTLHGSDLRLLESKRWMRPLASQVFRQAGIITTVSSWLADSLRTMFPAAAAKIRVASMPPNDDVFGPGAAEPAANAIPQILCVTRFTGQKRNGVLLEALAALHGEGQPFHCRFIGAGGSEEQAVVQRAADLGLSSTVEFVGAVDQPRLAAAYRDADLTVLPAVEEGFGMALVEAQLCGCATVGVRSGGITDIVDDGVSGYLAQPDDAADLARVLRRALADPEARRRMAQQGRESAVRTFASAVIAGRFISWYESLL